MRGLSLAILLFNIGKKRSEPLVYPVEAVGRRVYYHR